MIKRGDLIFFSDDSLLAKTISLVETGKTGMKAPSHIAVISRIAIDAVYIVEAQFGGVREIDMSIYDKSKKQYATMQGERDIDIGIDWLRDQIGKKYDVKQLIGIWMRGFLRILGPWWYEKSRTVRNFLDSRQSFICSELVERYAEITGSRLWPKADISQVTPWDLYRSDGITFYERGNV